MADPCWSRIAATSPAQHSLPLPQVYIANSIQEAEALVSRHVPPGSCVGYDVEWKPEGWPPGRGRHPDDGLPALVQLATPSAVVLLPLLQLRPRWPSLPRAYVALMADPRTVLLGVNLLSDVELVHGAGCPGVRASIVDLDSVALRSNAVGALQPRQQLGLSSLVSLLGGPPLKKPKHVQLANWAQPRLTPEMESYAALDAYAGGWIAGRLYQACAQLSPVALPPFHAWLLEQPGLPSRREVEARLEAEQGVLLPPAVLAAEAAVPRGGDWHAWRKEVVTRIMGELPALSRAYIMRMMPPPPRDAGAPPQKQRRRR